MIHPEVRKFLSEIGTKGGKVMTPKKRAALIRNAKLPRPGGRKKKS